MKSNKSIKTNKLMKTRNNKFRLETSNQLNTSLVNNKKTVKKPNNLKLWLILGGIGLVVVIAVIVVISVVLNKSSKKHGPPAPAPPPPPTPTPTPTPTPAPTPTPTPAPTLKVIYNPLKSVAFKPIAGAISEALQFIHAFNKNYPNGLPPEVVNEGWFGNCFPDVLTPSTYSFDEAKAACTNDTTCDGIYLATRDIKDPSKIDGGAAKWALRGSSKNNLILVNKLGYPVNIMAGGLSIAKTLNDLGQTNAANALKAAINTAGGTEPAGNSSTSPGFITADDAYAFTNGPHGKLCSSNLVDKNGVILQPDSNPPFFAASPANCDYSQGGMCYMKRLGF